MKKMFNVKVLVSAFIAGLVLVGVGTGVCFAELEGMKYCGEKVLYADETNETEATVPMPTEGNLYYYYENLTVEIDDSVGTDEARLVISAPSCNYVNVYTKDGYLINNETGHVSKTKGAELELDIYNNSELGGMEGFKEFVYDIKSRKIYDYTVAPSSVVVKVNSQNKDRVMPVSSGYSIRQIDFAMPKEELYDSDDDGYYIVTPDGKRVAYPVEEDTEEAYAEEYNEKVNAVPTEGNTVVPTEANTVVPIEGNIVVPTEANTNTAAPYEAEA